MNEVQEIRGELSIALNAEHARTITNNSQNRDAKRIHDHYLPELYSRIRKCAEAGGSQTQAGIYYDVYGDRFKAGAEMLVQTMLKQGFKATLRELTDANDGSWCAVEVSW